MVEHLRREVDAGNSESAAGQRDRQVAGAAGQIERRPAGLPRQIQIERKLRPIQPVFLIVFLSADILDVLGKLR